VPEVVTLEELWQWVAQHRDVLGMTDEDDWAMRNRGETRSEEKQDLLRRIAARCRATGIEPPVVKF
jgi:hypothetical protein